MRFAIVCFRRIIINEKFQQQKLVCYIKWIWFHDNLFTLTAVLLLVGWEIIKLSKFFRCWLPHFKSWWKRMFFIQCFMQEGQNMHLCSGTPRGGKHPSCPLLRGCRAKVAHSNYPFKPIERALPPKNSQRCAPDSPFFGLLLSQMPLLPCLPY